MALLVYVRRSNGNKTTWDGVWNGEILRIEEDNLIQWQIGNSYINLTGYTKEYEVVSGESIIPYGESSDTLGQEDMVDGNIQSYEAIEWDSSTIPSYNYATDGNVAPIEGISDSNTIPSSELYTSGNAPDFQGITSSGNVSYDGTGLNYGSISTIEGIIDSSTINSISETVYIDGEIQKIDGILGYTYIPEQFTGSLNPITSNYVSRENPPALTNIYASNYNPVSYSWVSRENPPALTDIYASNYNPVSYSWVSRENPPALTNSYVSGDNSFYYVSGDMTYGIPSNPLEAVWNIVLEQEEIDVTSVREITNIEVTKETFNDYNVKSWNKDVVCIRDWTVRTDYITDYVTTTTRTYIEWVTYYENDEPLRETTSDVYVPVDTLEYRFVDHITREENWCIDPSKENSINTFINTIEKSKNDLISVLEQRASTLV